MDAKVDIRKLQLLNDRICQTIEALNQVRLSVHGITHSVDPRLGVPGVGVSNLGVLPGMLPNVGLNIAQNPMLAAQTGVPFGFGQTTTSPFISGLSHTSDIDVNNLYARSVEPFLAARYAQWFPYAFSPISPLVPMW